MKDSVYIPRPSDDHPLIEDLVAFVDGELDDLTAQAVAEHLRRCTACQGMVANVAPPIDLEPSELDEVQSGLRFKASTPMDVTDEPKSGEVWQLDWEGDAVAAVVLEPDETGALVRIVTRDRPESAPASDQLPLAVPDIALWILPILAHVPLGVFRYPFAMCEPGAVPMMRARFQTPDSTPSVSPQTVDPLQRADLAAALMSLAVASWIPAELDKPLDLADLLRERQRRPSDVAEETGIAAADLTAVLRGTRQATVEEADLLAVALEVPAERLRVPVTFPDALVRAVERPMLRSAIEAKATSSGMTEGRGRLKTAEAVYAIAARTTRGERDVDTWTELIRQHLDA